MVINRRFRAIALPLMLYCVSGGFGSYFVWHATNGQRGLKAKAEYKRQMQGLELELAALRAQKTMWARRVDLMRGQTIDRDILDQEARLVLGRLSPDDVIVMLPGDGR